VTPHCKIHPVPATGTCNNCRSFTCDKCAKVGWPCPFCRMTDIVPAGESRRAVNQCVNHPGIRAQAACPDCQKIFCASCLNPFGQCMDCGARNPKQKPTVAPPRGDGGKGKRRAQRKRFALGTTRVAIGLAILGGVAAFANWQLGLIKSSMPKGKRGTTTVAGNVEAYRKSVDAHGKDLADIMGRIESGEYSDEDSQAVDDLMAKIESGQTVRRLDKATMDRLEKAKAMLDRGQGGAGADRGLEAAEGDYGGKGTYEGPPIRLRVGESRPEPHAGSVRGRQVAVAYRPRPVKVAITSPSQGARVRGSTVVAARLSGDDVQRVEFQVNGQWQGISNQPPFRFDWDTTGLRNGQVTLRVVAFDSTGRSHASPPLRVTVHN